MAKPSRLILLLIFILCLGAFPLPVQADSDIKITIDGNVLDFDVPPTILEERTLVPLRIIFESLGAEVEWDSITKSITGKRDNTLITLQADNTDAWLNGQPLPLDVPAMIIGNRTMVPARFIAEALGADVAWNEAERTVEIKSNLPYGLANSYILEHNVQQLISGVDEDFYREFESTIRSQFKPESFELLERYLRATYPAKTAANGIFIGPSISGKVQGIFEWFSGGIYVGEWMDEDMEGKGAYYWPDGGSYIGEWHGSRRNGWGILSTSDGDVYAGEWVDDHMQGQGVYYWDNGETYRGQWNAGQRQGLGHYCWIDGNAYIGQLAQGIMSGLGIFTWEDGEKYLGQFEDGSKNGYGIYYWRPDFIFRGEYQDDNRTWGVFKGPEGQLLDLRENAEKICNELIKPEMKPLEILKVLHDYTVLAVKYDRENFLAGAIPQESHTAYGVFVRGQAVCDGYAEALHSLLKAAGIENTIVRGEAKPHNKWQGHAWLLVKIDGKYSHVDVTWNDPDQGDLIEYDYFLVSDSELSADHRWDESQYEGFIN